jgi:hypothetical protein
MRVRARVEMTKGDDDDDDDDGCCVPVPRRASTVLEGAPVPESSTPRYQSVTVNLTRDQYARLRRQALERATSVSQLLRALLLERLQIEHEERHDHAR